ncbi:hypothetical protein SAMN05661093_10934 [Kibdelosporangium aridum]|uniref:Uncharacterized protein n=1 Tax=Kibdelosporangium aridum TaxID=2030 RepID=A0A1Y5YC38_KIBAR|nr:hypothetical protein SAMN05661093_10934 [Kibdelosporangium aridum]
MNPHHSDGWLRSALAHLPPHSDSIRADTAMLAAAAQQTPAAPPVPIEPVDPNQARVVPRNLRGSSGPTTGSSRNNVDAVPKPN